MKTKHTLLVTGIIVMVLGLGACGGPAEPEEPSGLIHVDQIGYAPNAPKAALVANAGAVPFDVVDEAAGRVVFQGKTVADEKGDPAAQEKVSRADFSGLSTPGKYFVRLPEMGRSHSFSIKEGVYAEMRKGLQKMFYFQRSGIDLDKKFADRWARSAGHTEKSRLYDNTKVERDGTGGWYDAGDYGRYTTPAAVTLADLFLAFRVAPERFGDDTGIPESGNGTPDLLDECRWELDWLLKMQDSANGGAYHKLTTSNFPSMTTMPDRESAVTYFLPVSANATGGFAAIMSWAARVYEKVDPAFAGKCRAAAEKAWRWLAANPRAVGFRNPPDVRTGAYSDGVADDERAWAAVELLALTGEKKYRDYVAAALVALLRGRESAWIFGWEDVTGYALAAYLALPPESREESITSAVRDFVGRSARARLEIGRHGYGIGLDLSDFVWGSNKRVTDLAKLFWLAGADASLADRLKPASLGLVHYLHGRNPLDQCYVTGFGGRPVRFPHHRPSVADMEAKPVPGMVAGGPNRNLQDEATRQELTGKPPMLCYADNPESFSTNEVAVYWNSSALFAVVWAEKLGEGK